MSSHIDVISNKPLAGEQHLLARVCVHDGKLELTAFEANEAQLRNYLREAVPDIDPDCEPDRFLGSLPTRIDSTYVVASAPHDASACPFGGGTVIAI